MKICIPTMDDRGKEATPSDHFGSARFFTFVDTETDEYQAVSNGGESHVHGACQPLKFLGSRPIDVLVCRGLGRRAFAKLQEAGVQVFVSLESSVQESVQALDDGRLRPLTAEGACHGHDGGMSGHGAGRGGGGHGHGHGGGGC